MCCKHYKYRHIQYTEFFFFLNDLIPIGNLQQDQEVQENQEVPVNHRRRRKKKYDLWHSHNHVIKRLVLLFTLSPTGPRGPIGPEEPCRQQRSRTQSDTDGKPQDVMKRARVRPKKWRFLQQLLEDQAGPSVQEDRSHPAPPWRPGKQTWQE